MILTLLPLMASADDSGSCGTNVTYTYVESTHTLTISGNGAMDDYTWDNHPGWYSYRSEIVKIVIENGVTSIGNEAFNGCSLTSITILGNVKSIGSGTFARCAKITDLYCHAEKVPSTRRDAFNNSYVEKATLHVPASALEAYKTTMPWSTFGTIVSIEDEAVAISTIADSNSPSGHVCNLQGQRLSSTRRGLFIRDGKKYVVK